MNSKSFFVFFLLTCWSYFLTAQVIATGGRHSIAICADSTVRTWGYNGYGQLGNGTINEQHTGIEVIGINGISKVAGGLFHSLFVKNDGTVWACGRNVLGPLGDGTFIDKYIPVQVIGLSGIVQVAAGSEHSLFLKDDGTVWACGANSSGQLGDGTNLNKSIPIQIPGLTDIIQVAAGAEFSLFLNSDGQVLTCGYNAYGQFGNGNTSSSKIPVLNNIFNDIKHISAGEWHSIFVKNNGTVFTCGRNNYGQLGDGSTVDKNIPVQINNLSGIIQADGGGIHSAFVKNDGTVWACGLNSGGNNNGQLGDGTIIDKRTPVQVIPSWGISKVVYTEAAREHSIYLLDNGEVWTSGRNNYGQLGYGAFTSNNSSTPVHANTICKANIVSVEGTSNQMESIISPNPFSLFTKYETNKILKNANLIVYNMFGQTVKHINNISGMSFILERDDLPVGIYFAYLLQDNLIIQSNKLILID